jgi:hypothetical protein
MNYWCIWDMGSKTPPCEVEEPDLTSTAGQGRKIGRERGYPELSIYRHGFVRSMCWNRNLASPPLARHNHIYIVARTTGTDQPFYANRERSSRGRIDSPFRPDQAQPDGGNSGTRRSRVAPRRGGTTRSGEHGLGREASRLGAIARSSRGILKRDRRAGLGFHLTPVAVLG